jgi:hypothetical protein
VLAKERPVADPKTYSQEEYDALVAERDAAKTHNAELFKEAKKAKDALKNYDGIDPTEHKRLKDAAEEAERKKATAEGDFKSLEKQLVEKHGTEIAAKDGRIGKLTKALEKRLIQAELTKAIAKARGDADLLLPHAEKYVRVKETDDDFVAYVADEKGNPLVSDGKGTPMDFDQLIEQTLKPKYPRAFDGTGSSGGGASKSSAGGGGGSKTIAAGDNKAFIDNLADIASGKVTVK